MWIAEDVYAPYFRIWVWLVGLVIVSVLASWVLPRAVGIFFIFGVAWVKAVLVGLHYMHLKSEKWQLCSLIIIPLVLVVGMTLTLFPDIVFNR